VRKAFVGLIGVTLVAGAVLVVSQAASAQQQNPIAAASDPVPVDDLPNPLEDKRRELRQEAINGVLNGTVSTELRNGSTVAKVGRNFSGPARFPSRKFKDQYVELDRQRTDRVFVILAEFGNQRSTNYPDQDTDPDTPGPTTFDGPLHNAIPQPDRTKDNSTVWQADFNRAHFQDIYFGNGESLRTYYETQSSGRYSINGTVTDWVKVPFNEARYGRSNGYPCGGSVCSNTWALIRDAANQWYADQIASGRTPADVTAEMATFDQWDRYDFDGDGNFNEPDGYIDHFQIVHAGGDQADGDPIYGEDAIWSHRWYANQIFDGTVGPSQNPIGGFQVGTTNLWIGDYTIQPENGGRSVFFHEFGHDLGLPDDYNIINGGDNNNEHWTLMAQSRLGARNDQGIGERAGDLAAWNKLQLGWLDYAIVQANQSKLLTLGPAEYNSAKPQGLVVVLPKKTVTTDLGAPFAGTKQWSSGDGNDLDNTLTRQVTLPAGSSALTFQARYDIEDCGPDPCDYAYVEVNDGSGWTAIPGNITTASEGNGINGTSTGGGWVPATFDLSAFAGKTIGLRFHYFTDGAVAGNDDLPWNGLFVDDIAIASTGFSDGAETDVGGWTAAGFSIVGSSISKQYNHYYIAAHRSYVSYDQYLKTGPYFFGYASTRPDFVDHYAYQQGLLISYWDTSYADNDTFAHPGSGRNLYIDAHPKPFNRSDGLPWRARVQVYDAPFGLARTDSMVLHVDGVPNLIHGQAGQPLFDDTKTYWFAELPNHGVKLPAVGVKIRVLLVIGTSITIKVN
jgi:immune inhibitor A